MLINPLCTTYLRAGVDKGKGGKYLILPPGYKDEVPSGYIAMQSDTYESYALLRSILTAASDADVAKAVAYGKRVKLYPLSRAAHPSATQFVDAIDVVYDANIPWDLRFFQSLDRIVQIESWQTRDKAMIDQLRSIGIEKGKPFNPDKYPVDSRGVAYTLGFFSAKHLGAGQFYLMTFRDKDGHGLEGGSTYRITVPANAPVTQYWSATAYDGDTHALIRNMKWASRSSQTSGLQRNTDGSVDVYFGPKTPAGKESNSVPTSVNGKFEILFRLYGPEKPLFDKTWKLPDIEKMN
jgi:hypothetical protein